MPTIKDVAKEAGVSIATVSYVLNQKTESISDETCQLVLAAAQRIGYTPNVTARNLRYSQTRLLGYAWHTVSPNQVNSVMDQFVFHLAHAAELLNYHILTFTHPYDSVPVYDELIRMRRVDGFILAAVTRDDPRIRMLTKHQFPFVAFGRSTSDVDYPWIDVDGRQGICDAVDFLVELGHRRIAMVAWADESSASTYRLDGYYDAMQAHGLPVPPVYVFRGANSEETGHQAIARWCELPEDERPTAVVAISDVEALGVMSAAEARGYVIGETLSVTGFDDVPLSRYLRPALTTLRQPIPEVANQLVIMLQGLLSSKSMKCENRLLVPKLIVRDSCGPPPQS